MECESDMEITLHAQIGIVIVNSHIIKLRDQLICARDSSSFEGMEVQLRHEVSVK